MLMGDEQVLKRLLKIVGWLKALPSRNEECSRMGLVRPCPYNKSGDYVA